MQKKIFTILLLLFLSSCGYEAIYSKKNSKNYKFFISELNFIGDRDINLRMKEKLNNYTLNEKNKNFALKISNSSMKEIAAKNTLGDAVTFKNTIATNIEVSMNGEPKNSFVIIESFIYNNNSNRFILKRYEKEIKNNLAETIADKLILKLSNIQ
jgi:outer membrane lipopolysaccharide assembly protein LptE/RlpB